MSTENQLNVSTNHSVVWKHMIYQLSGVIPKETKPVVETLLPVGATITNESTFHYANSLKITCEPV